MFFLKQRKVSDNIRRRKVSVQSVASKRWLQPLFKGVWMASMMLLCGVGLWQLNTQLSVSYWDIDAEAHVQRQIEDYLSQRDKDYWHMRASILQVELMQYIPDIEQVQVSRVLPANLYIKAKARQPIALWKNKKNQQVMLVDDKGVAYRALQRNESIDLPILRVELTQLQAASQVLKMLHQYDVRQLLRLSELIAMDESWRLNFTKGEQWLIEMGNLEYNVVQVINILKQPRWAKKHWRIDARMAERWFIRPAKQELI
ncbi:MAG: hypothetical protein Q9N67_05845 [Ghiorsea sp.]|nr:hypothetical protein [Ghiorsea sp.]